MVHHDLIVIGGGGARGFGAPITRTSWALGRRS
jgi:hypothetical protein